VGDSASAAARFTGSPYSRSFSPGLRLRLHPGLYAAACSAGSRCAFQKCSWFISVGIVLWSARYDPATTHSTDCARSPGYREWVSAR